MAGVHHLAAIEGAIGVAITADEGRDGVDVIERQIGKSRARTRGWCWSPTFGDYRPQGGGPSVHRSEGGRAPVSPCRLRSIFLDRRPGRCAVVRQVLRHRSIETTTSFYAGAGDPLGRATLRGRDRWASRGAGSGPTAPAFRAQDEHVRLKRLEVRAWGETVHTVSGKAPERACLPVGSDGRRWTAGCRLAACAGGDILDDEVRRPVAPCRHRRRESRQRLWAMAGFPTCARSAPETLTTDAGYLGLRPRRFRHMSEALELMGDGTQTILARLQAQRSRPGDGTTTQSFIHRPEWRRKVRAHHRPRTGRPIAPVEQLVDLGAELMGPAEPCSALPRSPTATAF